jgi:hypothetical protein
LIDLFVVCDVLWIENHIFLAIYARKRTNDEDDYINDGYIINRKPSTGTDPVYTRLAEITPIFTTEGRGNHFYMETIRGLGKEIKHLIIIANAASTEISVVGHGEDDEWATWQLPENGLANLQLSPKTSMDTYPVGLALDFTADEKLPAFDPSEKDVGVDPMPVFYYINDEGDIGSFHCYNSELARRGESYKIEAPPSSSVSTSAAPVANTPVPSTHSGFSAFGAATGSNTASSFGDLLSGKSVSPTVSSPNVGGFGSFSSFGSAANASGGSIPSFSNLGSAPKISSTGFGSSAATTTASPAFGSPTGFGSATNNKSSTPLFGSTTSFGANKAATSSFGSTSSFGALTNKTATPSFGSTPNFGSVKSTTSPFGSTSAFGAAPAAAETKSTTEKPVATSTKNTLSDNQPSVSSLSLGTTDTNDEKKLQTSSAETKTGTTTTAPSSAFGVSSTLGSSSFGSLVKNTIPDAKSPTTTIPTTSAFGTVTKNAVPGATLPSATSASTAPTSGSTSLFGSTSTTKPPITATTATSAFGTPSSLGAGGFGALSKNTVPGAKTPVATPAFGSTSLFGAPSSANVTTSTPKETPAATKPTFTGFGAAAKATTTSTATITPSVPTTKSTAPAVSSTPVVSTPATISTTTAPKDTSKPLATEPLTEKLKPTAEDGMAKGYEELYITVTEEIEKVKLRK